MALVNMFDSLATSAKQQQIITKLNSLINLNFIRVDFDTIALSSYTTDNQPQVVEYKKAGVTVATMTITYSGGAAGGNILTVVRT